MRQVLLVNQSTAVSETDFQAAANALQTQVTRDFTPLWDIQAKLWKYNKPVKGYELVYLLDDTDQAGALGYHTRLVGGQIVGYVFAKTDAAAGVSWTSTLSHELLELLANPWVADLVEGPYKGGRALYPYEVGDPVESNSYSIGGVEVSDFATPLWFQEEDTAGPFNFLKTLTSPFQLAKGGYCSVATSIGNYTDVWGETTPNTGKEARAGAYSRIKREQASRPVIAGFGSVDANLQYIIRHLDKQTALITVQTDVIGQQSKALADIMAAISDPNNDPQTLVDLTSKLKTSADALAQSVAANQPK